MFETLGDHGVRTACTPFLIYRGRTRHEMGLEGLLRRVALAATFRHATWGPDELFYGELYSSRRVPCKPTLARPGTRDDYSACCGRELIANDLYDFLLYSLPDNDYHSHRFGPEAQSESIVRADAAFAELVDAGGGLERFLAEHAVILRRRPRPDRGRASRFRWPRSSARAGGCCSRTSPTRASPSLPSARARAPAAVYVLSEGPRAARLHAAVREQLAGLAGVDLTTWLELDGSPVLRGGADGPPPAGAEAVVERDGRTTALPARGRGQRPPRRPSGGSTAIPRRSPASLGAGRFDSETYPNALARLWSALTAPHAGEILLSADPRLRAGRLGRDHPLPGRQPRGARGRRFARPVAALRARARGRGAPRAVDDRATSPRSSASISTPPSPRDGCRDRPRSLWGAEDVLDRPRDRRPGAPLRAAAQDPPRDPQAGELDAAAALRARRGSRLRGQPGRVRAAQRRSRLSPHRGRAGRLRRRRDQQLRLEPALDLRRRRRPRWIPGGALLHRQRDRARDQPGAARAVRHRRRPRRSCRRRRSRSP